MSENDFEQSRVDFSLAENDLLARLGADLAGRQALPLKTTELAERGKRWLLAQQSFLEAQVCSSDSIRKFTSETSDNAVIAIELAKLLAGLLLPVNPVTLSVLLIKRGLKTFCSARWSQHEQS